MPDKESCAEQQWALFPCLAYPNNLQALALMVLN